MTLAFVIVCAFIAVWAGLLWWIRKATQRLMAEMKADAMREGEDIRIGPQVGIFRGADSEFGNIKGTGVILLTSRQLLFRKLTGQRIAIDPENIDSVEISDSFKGAVSLGTGGKHLIIRTTNGNRVGFLIRDTSRWAEAFG